MKRYPIVFIIAVLLMIAAVAVFLVSRSTLAPRLNRFFERIVSTVTPTPVATATPPGPSLSPESASSRKTYTSDRLGVTFNYLEIQNGQTIGIKEEGNRIYVHPSTVRPETGQYLEVLQKDPDKDIISALETSILANFSRDNCIVVTYPADKYPSGFTKAQIEVPRTDNDSIETLTQKWNLCPKNFTTTNGLSYFIADPAHPDSYIYLNIGQYGILAGDNQPWQNTVRLK